MALIVISRRWIIFPMRLISNTVMKSYEFVAHFQTVHALFYKSYLNCGAGLALVCRRWIIFSMSLIWIVVLTICKFCAHCQMVNALSYNYFFNCGFKAPRICLQFHMVNVLFYRSYSFSNRKLLVVGSHFREINFRSYKLYLNCGGNYQHGWCSMTNSERDGLQAVKNSETLRVVVVSRLL